MKNETKATGYSIGAFALAMALVGNLVGVSFSTGREAMTFFVNFGPISLFAMALSYIGVFLFGYMAYATSINMNKFTFDWIMTPRGWKPLRIVILSLSLIILLSSLSAMYAGTGALLQAVFGVPPIVGSLFMVLASLLTVAFSMKRFTDTLSIMVPIMVVMAFVICIICTIWPGVEGSGWHSVYSENPFLPTWWLSALIFFGLQAGAIVQMIPPMAKQINSKKSAIWGNLLGGFIVYMLAAVLALAVVRNYEIARVAEIPIVELALSKSPILGILYTVVAILAIYSTTAAFLLVIKASLSNVKPLAINPKKLIGVLTIISFLALAVSFIGFSTIIDRLYAVNGTLIFITLMGLAFHVFHYRKYPQKEGVKVEEISETVSMEMNMS